VKLACAVGLVVALASELVVAPAYAAPDCAGEADQLRAHLEEADTNTFRWNLAWSVLFGAAAVGQVVLAVTETKPFGTFDDAYRDTMYVGAAKATIGVLSRVVTPLSFTVPDRNADRCAELVALRASLTTIAKKERQSFWLTHLGGTALNLAGVGLLWYRHSFKDGAISFAMSFPIGPIGAYTMPRASWHRWREQNASWSVGITVHPEHTMFSLAGQM